MDPRGEPLASYFLRAPCSAMVCRDDGGRRHRAGPGGGWVVYGTFWEWGFEGREEQRRGEKILCVGLGGSS